MASMASSGMSSRCSAVHQLRKPGGSSIEQWKSAYGTARRSRRRRPGAQRRERSPRRRRARPADMPAITTAGSPRRCDGTLVVVGRGDPREGEAQLVGRVAHDVADSGAASRGACPRGGGAARRGPRGPTGCSRKVSAVATPKLPPPPCSAQNSSGCSSAEARDQLAVGGDELDGHRGCRRPARCALEPARAAAQGEPGDPGARHASADGGQPVLLGGAVDVRPGRAAADAGHAAHGVDGDIVSGRTSTTRPPSTSDMPATECPPPRTARGRPGSRATARVATTSAVEQRATWRGAPVDHRVEERARLVVGGVAGSQHVAPQRVAELVQGGVVAQGHAEPDGRGVAAIPRPPRGARRARRAGARTRRRRSPCGSGGSPGA